MESCDRCNSLMESAVLENCTLEVEQCNGCGMLRIHIKEKPRHRPEVVINQDAAKAFFEPLDIKERRRFEWQEINQTEEAENYKAQSGFYDSLIFEAFKAPKFARGGFSGESWKPKGTIKKDGNG